MRETLTVGGARRAGQPVRFGMVIRVLMCVGKGCRAVAQAGTCVGTAVAGRKVYHHGWCRTVASALPVVQVLVAVAVGGCASRTPWGSVF